MKRSAGIDTERPGGWRGVAAVVASPAFMAGLLLLLLNDFVLKPEFGNVVTGKLSDFAGMWTFPAFLAAIWPRRRTAIYVLTAVAFTLWKSPLSGPAIDLWNGTALFNVGRVVDWTDLVALAMLPLSYAWFQEAQWPANARTFLAIPMAGLSMFAFMASSYRPDIERTETYGETEYVYKLNVPKSVLIDKLDEIDRGDRQYGPPPTPFFSYTYDVHIKDRSECNGASNSLGFRADFVDTGSRESEVRLRATYVYCDDDFDRIVLASFFEQEVIAKLREE